MLIQAQKDLIAAAMQNYGAEALKEVFTVAMLLGDLDTMQHIHAEYASEFTAEEAAVMQNLITVLEELQAAFEQEEDTTTHTLH